MEVHEENAVDSLEIERLKNARGMKAKGYPLEDIAQITGLSVEEIQKL